jgi:hypothetical protein
MDKTFKAPHVAVEAYQVHNLKVAHRTVCVIVLKLIIRLIATAPEPVIRS